MENANVRSEHQISVQPIVSKITSMMPSPPERVGGESNRDAPSTATPKSMVPNMPKINCV